MKAAVKKKVGEKNDINAMMDEFIASKDERMRIKILDSNKIEIVTKTKVFRNIEEFFVFLKSKNDKDYLFFRTGKQTFEELYYNNRKKWNNSLKGYEVKK